MENQEVKVKSSTKSSINWIAGIGALLALGTHYGLDLTPQEQVNVLLVITTFGFPIIMYLRTFVTKTVTPFVANKLK